MKRRGEAEQCWSGVFADEAIQARCGVVAPLMSGITLTHKGVKEVCIEENRLERPFPKLRPFPKAPQQVISQRSGEEALGFMADEEQAQELDRSPHVLESYAPQVLEQEIPRGRFAQPSGTLPSTYAVEAVHERIWEDAEYRGIQAWKETFEP